MKSEKKTSMKITKTRIICIVNNVKGNDVEEVEKKST